MISKFSMFSPQKWMETVYLSFQCYFSCLDCNHWPLRAVYIYSRFGDVQLSASSDITQTTHRVNSYIGVQAIPYFQAIIYFIFVLHSVIKRITIAPGLQPTLRGY